MPICIIAVGIVCARPKSSSDNCAGKGEGGRIITFVLSLYSADGFVGCIDVLYYPDLQAVMAEARSQQAASLTEFHWLGNRFPITNAKTRVAILKGLPLAFPVNVNNEVSVFMAHIKNQD